MNTLPSPTPYDIVAIPVFPFIPSTTLWLILASIAAISYLLFRINILKSGQRKIKKLTIVLQEIEKHLTTPPSPEEASLISLLVKRYLASESGRFGANLLILPSCSENEMIAIKKSVSIPQIQIILDCLIDLEAARFKNDKIETSPIPLLHSNLIGLNAREDR